MVAHWTKAAKNAKRQFELHLGNLQEKDREDDFLKSVSKSKAVKGKLVMPLMRLIINRA